MEDEMKLPAVLRTKLPPNLEKIKYGKYTKKDYDYPVYLYLKENDLRVDETGSDVVNFLKGKSILVTGATGFLGKLLVEKLLRCCSDIETIYIIVRDKKGKDVETRVKEYLDNWVFVKLSRIHPNFRKKVIGVSGDFEEDGLALSEHSRNILIEKVNIIYHVAATVRFDEKLKKAVTVNIKGTQELVKLAKECKKLEVLAHISTAYSNPLQHDIKEKFYPPMMNPQHLIDITERLSSEVVDKITPVLLGDYPNTYAFTKQIAEDIVRTETTGIPTCIQRPSIVVASVNEPVRSWVDNIYGPAGLILACALGLLHVMFGNPEGKCNMVPVDFVINNCIVASYKTAMDRITDKVQIYNFASLDSNPIFWKNTYMTQNEALKVGSTKIMKRGVFLYTKYKYFYLFLDFIFHTVPGYIIDFVAVRLGKKPMLSNIYSKINKFVAVLSYFTLNEWSFETKNTMDLWNSLNEKDKKNISI